jgi:hypothetical protein
MAVGSGMTEPVSWPPSPRSADARAQVRASAPTLATLGACHTAERDLMQRRLMLTARGDAARPWEMGGRVRSFCEHSPLRPRDVVEIEVCVVEALEYALGRCRRRPDAEIVLMATFTGAAFSIELTHHDDAAQPLDRGVPAARVALERGSRSKTGGLPLACRVMDEVRFHTHEGRSTLSFVRHLPRVPAGETR